ncbi:transcriptional repressor LexA [Heliobacterium undosum]|uniref:LexA repressor n=1 Tax=Heliomicrobium undosum TaxID=121734 RepID=A0A845L3R0_9FIRM|nr:transcriptional repressor LexA [Heliomicrobium undosum]MZP31262.1 transcriptional repressor LexA [Heliomicrobium undosum]
MMQLTPKEREVFEVIRKNVREKGYPPSVREIGLQMGWASSSTVHVYLKRLEVKGWIRKDPTKPRAIEVLADRQERLELGSGAFGIRATAGVSEEEPPVYTTNRTTSRTTDRPTSRSTDPFLQVPLLGNVAAGSPILATEYVEDYLPIAKTMLGEGEFFGLRVRGDSMIDAGILHGDTVIVRKQAHASNGQIVVALIDEDATVKRFFKEADHVRLQPENSALEPIRVRDLSVLGKVVMVLRNVH